MSRSVSIGSSDGKLTPVTIGGGAPLALICGPCVIESRAHALKMAQELASLSRKLGISCVFKSSYDKANRTSLKGFRGLGLEEGLSILAEVRSEFGLPVITDVHTEKEVLAAAKVVDILQIPAFLCRQTSMLVAAGRSGKPVMVKKGQFLHPEDMKFVAEKIGSTGNDQIVLCERGTCFGYRELVVDFRSLAIMAESGYPIVFDATHSVQVMGGKGGSSGGNSSFVPMLARAAVAVGVDAVFLESHEQPEKALSDGPNMVPLSELEGLLSQLKSLDQLVRQSKSRLS